MSQSDVTVRICAAGDEAALSLLGRASFLEAYAAILPAHDIVAHCERAHAPEVYRGWLQQSGTRLWLAEAQPGGAPVGYLVLAAPELPLADISDDDREIKRVYLLHRFQGRGLGRRLMDEARMYAKASGTYRLLLGVYSGNHAALAFYARLGYSRVGRRTFHVGERDYEDHVLALTL